MDFSKSERSLGVHALRALGEELRAHFKGTCQSVPTPLMEALQRLRHRLGDAAGPSVASSQPPAAELVTAKDCFSPEIIEALSQAFNEALSLSQDLDLVGVTREHLAQRLIKLAANGERDPSRMAARALVALITGQSLGNEQSSVVMGQAEGKRY
jgi:hypothetical protein